MNAGAVVVLAIWLVAGCTGATLATDPTATTRPSDGAAASPTHDPALAAAACDLVDLADVQRVMAIASMTAAPVGGDQTSGACQYRAGARDMVAIWRRATDPSRDFAAYLDVGIPVDDLGDAAIWVESPGLLLVRQGDRGVTIQVAADAVAPTVARSASIELARLALTRLD